ncbi:MAG: PLP-dependent cysteine synthase family protein [Catenulispora sp.]|nr:PLP-dependent cysteine synthase family protein [Catenulispora sp.]NUR61007.1 PLP-dependent cysteine synthase family protein [Catenulispora sp.]
MPKTMSPVPGPHTQTAEPGVPVGGIATAVGNTPVVFVPCEPGSRRGFWAKLEGANPGGIKDRSALYLIEAARRRGDLAPGAPVVESTSGTLGLGLALAGIAHGHPVTLVTDPGLEPSMRRLLSAYGATIDVVPAPHEVGGWQQARRDRVLHHLAATPTAWCPNQYDNPDNPDSYLPLGRELLAQLGHLDVLVAAVGTGGHSAGAARALREALPGLQVIGVDSIGSAIFGQPARPRLMRGLGSSIHPRNVDYAAFTEVHWVAPGEAVASARSLASAHYASGGWSVGAVALVAGWVARTRPAGTRIAAIFPDGPHRYAHTVFDDDYCRSQQLLHAAVPAEPEEISHPGEREAICWTRCTTVLDPRTATASATAAAEL